MLLLVCASKNSGVAATWISTIYFLSNWKNVWVKIGHTIESVPESLWKIILGKSLLYFKRSYTTSYKIRRSNLFDKQLLGNKQKTGKRLTNTARPCETTWRRPKVGVSRPARHSELGWSWPNRRMATTTSSYKYHAFPSHPRSSVLQTVNALSLVLARLELPLELYDKNCEDLFFV